MEIPRLARSDFDCKTTAYTCNLWIPAYAPQGYFLRGAGVTGWVVRIALFLLKPYQFLSSSRPAPVRVSPSKRSGLEHLRCEGGAPLEFGSRHKSLP